MKKRGMSAVIATVILIVLVLTLISIVWAVVNNLVSQQIDETESCFGIFDKIEIQNRYTYYDSSTNELEFSVAVKDVKIDEYDGPDEADEANAVLNNIPLLANLSINGEVFLG